MAMLASDGFQQNHYCLAVRINAFTNATPPQYFSCFQFMMMLPITKFQKAQVSCRMCFIVLVISILFLDMIIYNAFCMRRDLAEKAFRDGIERWRVKVNDTLMRAFVRCVGTERASVVCHQLGLNPAILHRIAGSSGMSTSHLVLSCLWSCFSGRMIITIFNFICIS